MLAITKDLLGTEKHLLQRKPAGILAWDNHLSSDFLTLGNVEGAISINSAFEIFRVKLPSIIPEEFQSAMTAIDVTEVVIPWYLVVPREKYIISIKNMLETLWDLFSKLQQSSYLQTYVTINKFIKCMQCAHINSIKLEEYIKNEKNPSIISTLVSFQPCHDGMTKKVSYNNSHTVTGRLIVQDGPKILTLPAHCRDIIKSRYEGGSILEIDFKSLEPRIALILAGKDPPIDVYDEISNKLFSDQLKRSEVKIAVLCALYGASPRKLGEILDNRFNASEVIAQIKAYFCYSDITNVLRHNYERDGFISNMFGRPIFCENSRDNILYSNFVQSTAADAAILGFKKLLNQVYFTSEDIIPLFMIHDALILDVKCDDEIAVSHNFVELNNIGKLYFEQLCIT